MNPTHRDPTLCREFVRQGKAFLSEYPEVRHTWSIDADEDHCILDIPEQSEDGFPITVHVWPNEVTVTAGGAHTNATPQGKPQELVARTLGYVQDLMSPRMRVRERLAGGRAYKWAIELCMDGKWETEEWVGLFFYNYFGRRSERTYQNRVLPSRANPVEPFPATFG